MKVLLVGLPGFLLFFFFCLIFCLRNYKRLKLYARFFWRLHVEALFPPAPAVATEVVVVYSSSSPIALVNRIITEEEEENSCVIARELI